MCGAFGQSTLGETRGSFFCCHFFSWQSCCCSVVGFGNAVLDVGGVVKGG